MEHPNQSQPNPGSRRAGPPCRQRRPTSIMPRPACLRHAADAYVLLELPFPGNRASAESVSSLFQTRSTAPLPEARLRPYSTMSNCSRICSGHHIELGEVVGKFNDFEKMPQCNSGLKQYYTPHGKSRQVAVESSPNMQRGRKARRR